jgi:malate permease and related proteins
MAKTAVLQVMILFVLILIGYALTKSGAINEERKKGISEILVQVVAPALIITTLQVKATEERVSGVLITFALGIVSYIIFIFLTTLFNKKTDRYDYRTMRFTMIYQNCGYMGIPFVEGLFGSTAVFYMTPLIVLFNAFAFTHGLVLMRNTEGEKFHLRDFLSPVMISIVLGLVFFFCGIRLPKVLEEPLEMLADLNSPLGMLLAGTSIAQTDLRHIKNGTVIIKSTLMRLFVLPLIMLAILIPLPVAPIIKLTVLTASACPTAALAIIMAIRYDRDEELAAEIFSVTTLLSMVSMPVILTLAELAGMTV